MTLADIETATAEEVRLYIDSFAIGADLNDRAVVDMLHAAKHRFMGIWARKALEEARS